MQLESYLSVTCMQKNRHLIFPHSLNHSLSRQFLSICNNITLLYVICVTLCVSSSSTYFSKHSFSCTRRTVKHDIAIMTSILLSVFSSYSNVSESCFKRWLQVNQIKQHDGDNEQQADV